MAKDVPINALHRDRKSPREYAHCIAGQGVGLLAHAFNACNNADSFRASLIKRPSLVIYHASDSESVPYVDGLFATLGTTAKTLVGLSGGTDSGCGYHLFAGLDPEFVAATASFIDKYNPTLAPPAAALHLNQHGLTGSWYEAVSSGQGILMEIFPNLTPGIGQAFLAWFTYDTVIGGADRQRWYKLQGPVGTGQPTASLTIYENTGGNFNAPPATNSNIVGSATLSFESCSSGLLTYSFADGSGRIGTIPLTRLLTNVTCSATSPYPTDADFALSGSWYAGPATSGQGFLVEVAPSSNTLFMGWFTYIPNGTNAGAAGQRWYSAQGPFTRGMRAIPVQIYESTGGKFDTPTPAGQQTIVVGTGTMAFQSCSAATFSYNFTGGTSAGSSGTINLSRIGPVPPGCVN